MPMNFAVGHLRASRWRNALTLVQHGDEAVAPVAARSIPNANHSSAYMHGRSIASDRAELGAVRGAWWQSLAAA